MNYHSVPQVNDEFINSFKIFVFVYRFFNVSQEYFKKNPSGVAESTHDE